MRIYDEHNDTILEVTPRSYTLMKRLNLIKENYLIFKHGHISITNYKPGDNREFEKALSVWNEMTFRYDRKAGHYIPELMEFRVPRCFDTAILQQYFPHHRPIVDNDAYPADKIDVKLLTMPRDDEQRVGLSFLCAQGDYKKNYRYTTLMLDMVAGSGKSFTIMAATCFLRARTVIIVPFSKLLKQWAETYTDHSTITKDEILIISSEGSSSGQDICMDILNGKHRDKKVFIFMIDSLVTFQKNNGNLKTIELLRATRAYAKVMDEIHREMKAMSMIDALSNFHMNYYASATPDRSQRKEKWIFRTIYRNCPRFGRSFKTTDEKWTNIIIARYAFVPTPSQIKRMVNPRKKWLNPKAFEKELIHAPDEQIVNLHNTFRNIMKWSKQLLKKGNKILILCSTIDGTEFFQSWAEEFFPGETSRYYGSMKTKDQEKALKATVICATSQSLGTGADIKGIQHVYNMETYANSVNAGQLPGRARKIEGVSVFYVEFVDFAYLKTYRQFESHKPYLIKASKTGKLMILE